MHSLLRVSRRSVPQRNLDRLKAQLTPLLDRAPVFPEDRDQTTRLIQEWQMRGLSLPAFNAGREILWEEHRAEHEARSTPLRRHYEQLYAPWGLVRSRKTRPNFSGFGNRGLSRRKCRPVRVAICADRAGHPCSRAARMPAKKTDRRKQQSCYHLFLTCATWRVTVRGDKDNPPQGTETAV
jgi:hypothetical protein